MILVMQRRLYYDVTFLPFATLVLNYPGVLKIAMRRKMTSQDVKLRRKMTNLVMTVVRTTASGNLADAKPCVLCLYAMYVAGIKKVRYSDDTGEIVDSTVKKLLDGPVLVSGGVRAIFRNAKKTGDRSVVVRLPLPKNVIARILQSPDDVRIYFR